MKSVDSAGYCSRPAAKRVEGINGVFGECVFGSARTLMRMSRGSREAPLILRIVTELISSQESVLRSSLKAD